ncbi:MAG: two-component regulator propeller domain-containing protein, partial [Parafilimonas sp.]
FEHFIYTNEKNNFIRSLYYDEQKHFLLAGCYNGGIQLYDTLGNPLWQHAIVSDKVKDVNAIEKLSNNNYLIETIGKGWYILHLSSKSITPVVVNNNETNALNVYAISFLNNLQRIDSATLFIATINNVYDCVFKNNTLISAKPLLPFTVLPPEQIDCFLADDNNILWVGTNNGKLYRADKNKHVFKINIPGNFPVRSLTQDAAHNIWVGTDKGLYVYNNYGQLIKNITTQTGLLNDCIYALLPVKNQAAVFASSNLGLSFVALHNNIINYTKESGLQENEFNSGSCVKSAAGKFFFGGVNGITSFYASSLSNIKDTPVLNLTKFIVNDSAYNVYADTKKEDTVYLSYTQNHIQMGFAALGILNTNEYKYEYRLNGFEKNRQITHNPTDIKYVLSPGNYSFEITCSPVFSSTTIFKKTIVIIVSPPWWQTWWFKILVVVLGVTIIAFIIQQYLHRHYQKNLNALQLQQQIQHERERISHDLHDNLGAYAAAISSNISSIQNLHNTNNDEAFNQLKNNSQSIINQLNDTIWALNKEAISLTAVSDRFKLFLQKMQPSYATVFIGIKEEIIHDAILSPANALHLFRIMQEAINNALRHSNCKNVLVKIISNDGWQIIIKDDGKGMNENNIAGNGLKNIRLRAAEAGWHVRWTQEIPPGTSIIISSTIN